MFRYLLRRIALTVPSLFGVVTLAFLLIHLVPGDPVDLMLGEQAAAEDKANLRAELGLDRPLPAQFASHLAGLAKLDFGESLVTREPVREELFAYFPATVELAVGALALAILWGLPVGVWSAASPRSLTAAAAEVVGLWGMSVPAVFLGPALIFLFAIRLEWLPVSERGGIEHLILPACSLALPLGAVIMRMTRAAVTEVLREDYIRTARAKGAGETRVQFVHALRNALIPIVTILTLQLGALLTGTVITETIFDWPGLGSLLYGAIQRRDYPMVQSCILLIAVIYVLVNLAGDLLYAIVNPRIRLER